MLRATDAADVDLRSLHSMALFAAANVVAADAAAVETILSIETAAQKRLAHFWDQ